MKAFGILEKAITLGYIKNICRDQNNLFAAGRFSARILTQLGHFYIAGLGHYYFGSTVMVRIMYIMLNYAD